MSAVEGLGMKVRGNLLGSGCHKGRMQKAVFSIAVISALAALAAPTGAVASKPANGSGFKMGVYLNSSAHPSNLQMSRMVADWANHGVTQVAVISYVYIQLAPQGLNTQAKRWGIDLYISNCWPAPLTPMDEVERDTRATIALVNSYVDSDAVKGWYAGDEVEFLDPTKLPGIETYERDYVSLLRRLDPKRRVAVNHTDDLGKWNGRFMKLGEDVSWCSVFWANHFAEARLNKVLAAYRAAYGPGKALTAVFGAQSLSRAIQEKQQLSLYGLEGLTLEQAQKSVMRADIADYILTAHRLGFAGASLFVYDGYYDATWYSLVDERGRSREGRMEGIRDAMEQIRKSEGCPSLKLDVKFPEIQVTTFANRAPVRKTTVEVSYDSGHTWRPVSGFGAAGGRAELKPPVSWMRSEWTMVRARCYDGRRHSLWSVWNCFPWREPT